MEAMFTILARLVVAVRSLSEPVADALDFVVGKMRVEWVNMKEDLDHYSKQSAHNYEKWAAEREVSACQLQKVRDLEAQLASSNTTTLLGNSLRWLVTVPLAEIAANKILCIKTLRVVYPGMGLGEAKEEVEGRIDNKEQLFPMNISTKEMVAAVEALMNVAGSSRGSPHIYDVGVKLCVK